MIKSVLFLGGGFILICVVLVFLFNKSNQAIGTTNLSERSKEYLKKQQSQANSDWRTVNVDPKNKPASPQIVTVGTCFQLEVPFAVITIKHMDECFDQIAIDHGIINAYTKHVSYTSLVDDPGVRARRLDPETYQEEQVIINGREFFIFSKKNESYEKSALFLNQGILFSLNLLSSSSEENLDTKFNTLLESVKFEKQ